MDRSSTFNPLAERGHTNGVIPEKTDLVAAVSMPESTPAVMRAERLDLYQAKNSPLRPCREDGNVQAKAAHHDAV